MSTEDLKRALLTVAEAERPAADPDADLARARTAARARSRRRFRLALSGATTSAVLAVGAVAVLDRDPAPSGPSAPAVARVELVAEPFEATPYTFDLTPEGWSVQAQQPTAVTIAPDDGSTSDEPNDFRGKLVIMFDANEPDGRVLDRDGRRFWVASSSDSTTVATRSRAGEPAGVVRIQYPSGTGWDLDAMVTFLASVHVGPGARLGVG